MLFEIKNAKLVEVTDVASGTAQSGNEWTRANAIFEKNEGDRTDTYALLVFNDKIQEVQALVGSLVDVKYGVRSRKYNGRWYVDLKLFFIAPAVVERTETRTAPAPAPARTPAPAKEDDPNADLPF